MLKVFNTLVIVIVIVILLPGYGFSKETISMSDDTSVNNCIDYNLARKNQNIFESSSNLLYASEYLECSLLDKNFKKIDKLYYESDLKIVFKKFTLRSVPSSLGPRIDRSDTLYSLGGTLDLGNAKITLTDQDDNFVLSLKGKIGDKYLVWIVDEVLSGTYRSYYPALLTIDGDKVTASPLYESGY